MQRIIITEVDNTSNVEALSSYDVVYVPGFSNNGASPTFENGATLFRTPTLVTSKYEFLRLFGNGGVDDCPRFPKDQPYPIATENKYGFPPYAIPGYIPPVTPSLVAGVNNITYAAPAAAESTIEAVEATGFYTNIATTDIDPDSGIVYYIATATAVEDTVTVVMSALPAETSYEGLIVFTSSTAPCDNGWMIKYGDDYIYTDDTFIDFQTSALGAPTEVKDYYISTVQPALMFSGPTESTAGDPDPGYRYALYLLSLGIPVYYEQMNSSFEPVDMNDPTNAAASPVANDWFIEVEGNYIRTDDETVQVGTTYYKGADISIESLYKGLEYRFNGYDDDIEGQADYSFDSMGDYAVKYITSGGYPTFEYGVLSQADSGLVFGTSPLAEQMIRLAAQREDAVALIDHTNNPNRTIYATDTYSVISRIRDEFSNITTEVGSYGTMFTPWYTCSHAAITGGTANNYGTGENVAQMPGSLAFLSALAQQLKNYNPWLAVSGVSRGPVPYCSGLHTNFTLTNNVADSYQIIPGDVENLGASSISINPITYIRNYGYCIWGNRTLRNNSNGTKATSFLNIRDMVSDIKKRLYEASQSLLFEQNTDVLWINFKSLVTPLLDTMVSNYILSDYSIVKYNVDPETGQAVPSYKILSAIRIVPINSVEVFELTVQLENNEVTVAEVE